DPAQVVDPLAAQTLVHDQVGRMAVAVEPRHVVVHHSSNTHLGMTVDLNNSADYMVGYNNEVDN
ncbi:hypothetical protein, partial [Neobacillus drentensis]